MWGSYQCSHDDREVVEVSYGCQGEIRVVSDGAWLSRRGLQDYAGRAVGERQRHAFDDANGFEASNREEIERCVPGVRKRVLREIGVVVDIGVDAAAIIHEFRGIAGGCVVDAGVGGHRVVLLKPLTYMNLSGQSIAPAAAFYKIPRNHIIVLCDDIAQEPGHIRIRPSGSAGGHNGLKSIIASTGGEDFYRIRIGVGAKPRPDYDLADWVLGKVPPDDAKLVTGRHTDVEAACRLLMAGKLGEAQNKFNH